MNLKQTYIFRIKKENNNMTMKPADTYAWILRNLIFKTAIPIKILN